MKTSKAFTIVELVVVIAVTAILSAVAIVTFANFRTESRDAARQGSAIIISEGLEKYYEENGEYPSVASITNDRSSNTGEAVSSLLSIPAESLLMPNMPSYATNALSSDSEPHNDYIVYAANRETDASSCQDNINGGCDSFTLTYVEESGDTRTIKSRRSKQISEDNSDAPGRPSEPVITITANGNEITATASTVACETGSSPEYSLRQHHNTASYDPWSSWSSTKSHTQSSSQGYKYFYQAKARCISSETIGDEAIGQEATYVSPINVPATPPLSVSTAGNTSTWEWTHSSCPTGTTPEYQTWSRADSVIDSGWTGPYTGNLWT